MNYNKQPISLEEQISRLQSKGLIIDDEEQAKEYLGNIGYYRLRAYTYPFQENEDSEADHRFIRKDIRFSDLMDLYRFDRRLRLLLFNAIEKAEVAIRTRIVQAYADTTKDSHWFIRSSYFNQEPATDKTGGSTTKYALLQQEISKAVDKSKEDCIKHYRSKYDTPVFPPSWTTFEVLSLGTLSRLYSLVLESPTKTKIAKDLGLPKALFLENWLRAITECRNYCAHHVRIWNKRFLTNVLLPYNTTRPFLSKTAARQLRTNKIFAVLCCLKYISDLISPGSHIREHLIELINGGGRLLNLKDMGFPPDWRTLDVWKERK